MCNFDRDVVATLNLFKSGCREFHLELMKSDTGETGEPLKVAVTVYPLNHLEGRTVMWDGEMWSYGNSS